MLSPLELPIMLRLHGAEASSLSRCLSKFPEDSWLSYCITRLNTALTLASSGRSRLVVGDRIGPLVSSAVKRVPFVRIDVAADASLVADAVRAMPCRLSLALSPRFQEAEHTQSFAEI